MLVLTAVFAVILAALNWLQVPRYACVIVLVLLSVSILAALGLVVAIASSISGDEEDD